MPNMKGLILKLQENSGRTSERNLDFQICSRLRIHYDTHPGNELAGSC